LSKAVQILSVAEASLRFKYEVPEEDSSSAPVWIQKNMGLVGVGQGKETRFGLRSPSVMPFWRVPGGRREGGKEGGRGHGRVRGMADDWVDIGSRLARSM